MLPLLAGAAAVVYAGYASMSPGSQLYGRTFVRGRRGSRQIALTFDDGPNDPHTLHLLDILARHQVQATFFMIGRYVREQPRIARAVADAGHVIGNHTDTHPNLIGCTSAQVNAQLGECERALSDAVGGHSRLFRPPFGARLPHVLHAVRRRGMEPVMWSISSCDWNLPTADAIERRVARRIHGGDVVLMHDGGHRQMGTFRGHTVEAAERLIQRFKREGFKFVTIPEMLDEQKR
ncbi:MAG: polysaccharide deacetylase family protein [Acidobacteriaceae bacterium]|nr:polysaccharide deacetylase family protein [Acidobacteriaceae bacterium]